MKLPADLLEVEQWKAFIAPLPSNEKRHRIIICYIQEDICRFFYVTSQIEKAKIRSRYDIGSFVEIHMNEWKDVLTKDSCVECGKSNMKKISIKELKLMYENDELKVLGKIPENIKNKIIQGINDSYTYTQSEKEMFGKNPT